VQTWRKVDESNADGSSPCTGFQDQLPTIQQQLPNAGSRHSWLHHACVVLENLPRIAPLNIP